jgi:hypothetical protein
MPLWYDFLALGALAAIILALLALAIHTTRSVTPERRPPAGWHPHHNGRRRNRVLTLHHDVTQPIPAQPAQHVVEHRGAEVWWSPRNDIAQVSRPEVEQLAEARREVAAILAELQPMLDAHRAKMAAEIDAFETRIAAAMRRFHVEPVTELQHTVGPAGTPEYNEYLHKFARGDAPYEYTW